MNKKIKKVFTVIPNDNIIIYLVRLGSILFFAFILTTELNYIGIIIVATLLLTVNLILKTEYNYFYDTYFEQYEYGIIPFLNNKVRIDFKNTKSIEYFVGFKNPLKFIIPGKITYGIDVKDEFVVTFNDSSQIKIQINGNTKQMKNVVLYFKEKVNFYIV